MKVLLPDRGQGGFALLEVLVALTIMAVVGLMAWRGMDAMIRGSELIERHRNQDAVYFRLVQQFDRDCKEMLSAQELGSVPMAFGAKNIWWPRHYRADGNDAWLLVGYGVGSSGLQRWTSRMISNRLEFDPLWMAISRDPDLLSTNLQSTLELSEIGRQTFSIIAPLVSNGVGVNRGINIQWLIQGISFPINRSCLIGGGL